MSSTHHDGTGRTIPRSGEGKTHVLGKVVYHDVRTDFEADKLVSITHSAYVLTSEAYLSA